MNLSRRGLVRSLSLAPVFATLGSLFKHEPGIPANTVLSTTPAGQSQPTLADMVPVSPELEAVMYMLRDGARAVAAQDTRACWGVSLEYDFRRNPIGYDGDSCYFLRHDSVTLQPLAQPLRRSELSFLWLLLSVFTAHEPEGLITRLPLVDFGLHFQGCPRSRTKLVLCAWELYATLQAVSPHAHLLRGLGLFNPSKG